MKALVYTEPGRIIFREEPDPAPAPGEALIRVEAVGICGSDLHAYLGHDERRPPPLILGHEVSGRALSGEYEGQRVVLNPLVTCGRCDLCLGGRSNLCSQRQIIGMPPRQGAYAELVAMPEVNLVPVSGELDPVKATLAEPVATALHAIAAAVKALASGALGPLDWVETRALSDGAQAFADLEAGKTAAAKILLRASEPVGAAPLCG